MKKSWNKANWHYKKNKKQSESILLNLDSRKAYYKLGLKPILKFEEVIDYTTIWYKEFYEKKQDTYDLSLNQIKKISKFIEVIYMKVVILAGGLGTRISEYTKSIPKPMIPLNGKPIIYYIMKHFYNHGIDNFYVAIGYKGNVLKKFFKDK